MIVQVKQGKLKGIQNISVLTGKPFYSFLGVPYAKPPIGDLRFQPPEPADSWDGIRDADKEGNICAQWDLLVGQRKPSGSEDCLYLNVHTPQPPTEIRVKKPVMVFIHGGGFLTGSGSSTYQSPDYLMDYDVIFVSINYRLHVFGFLNMGLKNSPGNVGMKDQTLALKWIKENISNFGGDPENITIFGESAGGASVNFHMLSPASKGLFNRAIAQSGNAFTPWSQVQNPTEQGFTIGKLLGFEGNDPEKLVEFLKEAATEDLVNAANRMSDDLKKQFPGKSTNLAFVPSVEVIKEGAFLPDLPEKLQSQADPIPFLTGFNNKEGILLFLAVDPSAVPTLLKDFSQVIKDNFDFTETELADVTKLVEEMYCGSEEAKLGRLEQLVNLYTDVYFYKFRQSYEYLARSNVPVYLYEFSYDGGRNFIKMIIKKSVSDLLIKGAAHGDELGYIFNADVFKDIGEIQDIDRKVIHNVCSLWTNFAKTGNPTCGMSNIEWKPWTAKEPYYLRIDADLQLIQGNIQEKRLKFWETILTDRRH